MGRRGLPSDCWSETLGGSLHPGTHNLPNGLQAKLKEEGTGRRNSMAGALERDQAHRKFESLIGSLEARVGALAAQPSIGVEPLHVLHRDLRRLSVWFRPWKASISPDSRKLAKEVQARMNAFARLCGEVRDRDVGLSVLPTTARRSHRGIGPEGIQKARARFATRSTDRSTETGSLRRRSDRGSNFRRASGPGARGASGTGSSVVESAD